ncbi:hypothetical protein DEO72_LG3g1036 [Vigna unguiculata]|uniref:Uncharacterized protein n=1 Tax=Vigna unguiculata TaxID=3917 RepID=A0A4D6LDE2_VIGUN|nr:hypothetical protein DEO72_LG3g1036 [Vigna unguiculata]
MHSHIALSVVVIHSSRLQVLVLSSRPPPPPPPLARYGPPPPPPPPPIYRPPPNHIQFHQMQDFPVINEDLSSSSSHISGDNNRNKVSILPEGDGFDQHKLVLGSIASIIRTNLEEGKPSWKKLSKEQRESWFDMFKSKFSWPPQCNDMVRRNFERRGA